MHPFHHAAANPQKAAIIMASTGETMTFAELETRSNQAANLFRANGLQRGDMVAILLLNRLDYLALTWGAQRAGLYFTCISTKSSAEEAAYVIADCGARMLVLDASLAHLAPDMPQLRHRFAAGGAIAGYLPLEAALDAMPQTRIADESTGRDMLYSSGTTGRPKGIKAPLPDTPIDAPDVLSMLTRQLYGFREDMVYLSPAPLYHAAPLRYSMAALRAGGTVVLMEKFDPGAYLALVEQYRATHSQLVPTMFVRMLKLPEEARRAHDLSSLEVAIHAAAPCPVEVKQRMLDWWGDCIHEYYSATEGSGFCAISPAEWRQRPGSVGRNLLGEIRVVDADGNILPPGREGRIHFPGAAAFDYHGSPEKTAEMRGEHGPTFGDIGYVDTEGYLWLTDRESYMIISGGVNVYPQEVENLLVMHPKVADVAVIGVPDEELGEEVKAIVEPRDWQDAGPALAAELIAFARDHLSHVKCPRSIDFERELPRHDTGKLYKRLLKDRYRTTREPVA